MPKSPYELAYRAWRDNYLKEALEQTGGCESRAAKLIGVHRNTIQRFVSELSVSPKKMRQEIRKRRFAKEVENHSKISPKEYNEKH